MRHRFLRVLGLATAVFASVSSFNSAIAETLLPALGARAAGRGGTNFAFSDNGYVLHDNPAGLLGATKCECGETVDLLEVSAAMLFPSLQYSDQQNPGVSASNDPFGLGALTIAHRVNDDLAVGLGVYTPAGFGARWNMEGPPGPLAGPPTLNDSVPQNWQDAIVVKSGIEQDIGTDKTIRAGYSYNNDAVQNSTMIPYIPTILSHYFTGGFGLKKCGWEYDAAYQYSFRPTLHVAASDLAGSDFASSSFHTAAHWMFLSASRKF